MHTIEANIGNRLVKYSAALGAAALVSLSAGSASASTGYWTYLVQNYSFAGDCTVCHMTAAGGDGTVTKPFGRKLMEEYDLDGGDQDKFESVMTQITADGLDTDGDKATDIEELSGGGDPNDSAILPGGFEAPLQPEYGCVGTIAGRTSSTDGLALTIASFVTMMLLLKRRR